MPMAELFDEPQLEILDDPSPASHSGPTALEELILFQLHALKTELRRKAARAAAIALVDVYLSTSNRLDREPLRLMGERDSMLEGRFTELLFMLFRRLPKAMRRPAARSAIQAMLKVDVSGSQEPTERSYRAINRTSWALRRIERDRPPLRDMCAR